MVMGKKILSLFLIKEPNFFGFTLLYWFFLGGAFALFWRDFLKVFGVKKFKTSLYFFKKMCGQLFELSLYKLNFYIMMKFGVGQILYFFF